MADDTDLDRRGLHALHLYQQGDYSEASRVLTKLHVDIYEGALMHDLPESQAYDLKEILEQDFPHRAHENMTPAQERMASTFFSTAKIIASILSDYLLN